MSLLPIRGWNLPSHYTCCPSSLSADHRRTSKMVLWKTLEDMSTPDVSIKIAMEHISTPAVKLGPDLPHTTWILSSQKKIGRDQFLHGHISLEWRHCYNQLHTPNKHPKPVLWVAHLITAIWNITLSLWKYRSLQVHGENETAQENYRLLQY